MRRQGFSVAAVVLVLLVMGALFLGADTQIRGFGGLHLSPMPSMPSSRPAAPDLDQ
jgi:hypothetical protein